MSLACSRFLSLFACGGSIPSSMGMRGVCSFVAMCGRSALPCFLGWRADSLPLLRVLMQEPFCVVKSCVRCLIDLGCVSNMFWERSCLPSSLVGVPLPSWTAAQELHDCRSARGASEHLPLIPWPSHGGNLKPGARHSKTRVMSKPDLAFLINSSHLSSSVELSFVGPRVCLVVFFHMT